MKDHKDSSNNSREKGLENDQTSDDEKDSAFRSFLKNITVEPMLFPYLLATILVILANQNLHIQKACRVNLNLSRTICNELENKNVTSTFLTNSEIVVQKLVANMLIWQTILQSSGPAVFVLFLGSWSDRNRLRRPCMLLPIYGEIIRELGLIVCVIFFDQLPMEVSGLWQVLPIAVTGFWTVMFMAVYAYIGDVSTENNKSTRVALVNATMALCLPLGTGMSGILYRKLGFIGVYVIALMLCCISALMAHIFIHDTRQIKFNIDKENKASYWNRIKFFFNLKHIGDAFKITFKNGKNNRRVKVIALTVLITCVMGPLQGEKGISYLFTRVKFNWNELQYSIYSTFSLCTNLVGTFFTLGFLIRKFGVSDALIGTIATTTKFITQFIFSYAKTEIVFYSGGLVNCLQGPAIISMKSILSKIIPSEELGQVTAVTGIGENIIPILCGPFYSYVYEATVSYFPSAYFLLTAAITLPTIFLYLWLYGQYKTETRGSYEILNAKESEQNGTKNIKHETVNYGTIES